MSIWSWQPQDQLDAESGTRDTSRKFLDSLAQFLKPEPLLIPHKHGCTVIISRPTLYDRIGYSTAARTYKGTIALFPLLTTSTTQKSFSSSSHKYQSSSKKRRRNAHPHSMVQHLLCVSSLSLCPYTSSIPKC